MFALRTLPAAAGQGRSAVAAAPSRCTSSPARRVTATRRRSDATVAAALAGLDVPDPAAAIDAAVDDGAVMEFRRTTTSGRPQRLLSLTRYAMAEESIGEGLARLLATAEPLATPEGATAVTGGLDPAQREAVQEVAAHGVVVCTAGPAPARADRRCSRGARGCATQADRARRADRAGRQAARRAHRPRGDDTASAARRAGHAAVEFLRGETWPLDADVVVVDETSMLDVELAAALVEACADGTHLLLVGDPAQLPSIGPGRVLGDRARQRGRAGRSS